MVVLLSTIGHAGDPPGDSPVHMTEAEWTSFWQVVFTQDAAIVTSVFEVSGEARCVFDCWIQAGALPDTRTNNVVEFRVRPYPPAFTAEYPLKMQVDVILSDREAGKQAYFMEKTATNTPWQVTQGWTMSGNGDAARSLPLPAQWPAEGRQTSSTLLSLDAPYVCHYSDCPATVLLKEYQSISGRQLADRADAFSGVTVTLMCDPQPRGEVLRLIENALSENGITIVNVGTNSVRAFWTPKMIKAQRGIPSPRDIQTGDEAEHAAYLERKEKRRQALLNRQYVQPKPNDDGPKPAP